MDTPMPDEAAIFNVARRIEEPEARRIYIEHVCTGNPSLKDRIHALLRAHEEERSFLESPPVELQKSSPSAGSGAEGVGTQIGAYKLVEQIGEGGFGVVYMAEQQQPIRRKVAVKILKPGMDTRQVIARFEAERQALALMEHANIARVLDAGETASGRPYFVMELVKGIPITRYCDEQQLTPRERLALFMPVCHAVQHAHQKGIIHRDLKPTNVLIAAYDGMPVPKVIDFGVAKALGQPLTERTLITGFGGIIGTLEYMSPEQAEFNALDVDTRADIYSLGVLLYELLTGTTPLTKEQITQAAVTELLRLIREEEPPRPSTRLSDSKDSLASISAQRKLEPARLTKEIRGELDWIVMKALEKDRNRRYETANGFAMDVQRYLADEPVLACPPSAGYRLRKIARRHWRGLSAAGAFVLLLVGAVAALSIALVAVNRERREKVAALDAEANRRKQTRAALDAMSSQIITDWLTKQTALLPEHQQFLEMALRYYEEFAADTGQEEESRAGVARAYVRVGAIRNRLGQRQDAEAAWERGRELFVALAADFPGVLTYQQSLAEAHQLLGQLFANTGRAPKAEEAYGQALAIHRQLAADFPVVPEHRNNLAETLTKHAVLFKNSGRFQEAEHTYGQALAIRQQLVAEFPTQPTYRLDLGMTHQNLGLLLDIIDRPRDAVESLKQSVAIHGQLVAEFPNNASYRDLLAIGGNNLADAVRRDGRHDEAEAIFGRTVAIRRELVADFPAVPYYRRGLAISLNNLGILLKDTGQAPEAEELYSQALAIHKQLAADFATVPDHQNEAAGAMVNLARLLLARKELDGARRLLEEAAPYHQAALKASPQNPAYRRFYRNNRWRLAEVHLELNDHAAAAETADQFLQAAVEPPRDAYTAATLLAGCVRLAAQDKSLPEGRRQELTTTYCDRALAALRLAIERGAKEVAQVNTDTNLDPLRQGEDFQKLLTNLEQKPNESGGANPMPE